MKEFIKKTITYSLKDVETTIYDASVMEFDNNNYIINTGISYIYIINKKYCSETVGLNINYFTILNKRQLSFDNVDTKYLILNKNKNCES